MKISLVALSIPEQLGEQSGKLKKVRRIAFPYTEVRLKLT